MDLDEALNQFDAVEANLQRLDAIWNVMSGMIPDGMLIFSDGPETRRYAELQFAFSNILSQIPAIDGWNITSIPVDLNGIAQMRLDAEELGDIEVKMSAEDAIDAPGKEIHEYRFRMHRVRRSLVRARAWAVVSQIDELTSRLQGRWPRCRTKVDDPDWNLLKQVVAELDRLAGDVVPRTGRWRDLMRHLHWGEGEDVQDIAGHDWPSVRADVMRGFDSELDPLPVTLADLTDTGEIETASPVATKLQWERLDAEEFERLLFNIISDASDYDNPQWLMQTNAPDRGRDISAIHRTMSTLSGTRVERVIFQAKHWKSRSVATADVSEAVALIKLWEPPIVSALVIATSGRFTADAVAWVERHNHSGERPHIEMWPDSHLESLLAQRPYLVATFRLRG